MRSICLFSSYFTKKEIPYYVCYYLEDLATRFSEIWLLTNNKNLSIESMEFLSSNNIALRLYDNEGMDFGMWKKAMNEIDLSNYDRIGLVNDSCVMFNQLKDVFEKADKSDADVFGLVLTGKISMHLQSYFILINKNAIGPAVDFIRKIKSVSGYKQIIFENEIGLSSHLLKLGLRLAGYFDYSKNTTRNPSFIFAKELIRQENPMIKKKLLNRNYRAGDYLTWMRNTIDIDSRQYVQEIHKIKSNERRIDIEKVMIELRNGRSRMDIHIFRLAASLYNILRKISFLRFVFHQLIRLKRVIGK